MAFSLQDFKIEILKAFANARNGHKFNMLGRGEAEANDLALAKIRSHRIGKRRCESGET